MTRTRGQKNLIGTSLVSIKGYVGPGGSFESWKLHYYYRVLSQFDFSWYDPQPMYFYTSEIISPWFYRSKSCFLQAMAESSESLTLTLTLTPFKCVEWNGERNVCSVLVWEPDKSFLAKLECCCGWLSWHCCAVSRVVARWLLTGSKQKIPPSTPNYGSGVSFVWWIFLLLYNQPKSNHLKVTFALANTINNAIS